MQISGKVNFLRNLKTVKCTTNFLLANVYLT